MEAYDRVGLLRDITMRVSEERVNIASVVTESRLSPVADAGEAKVRGQGVDQTMLLDQPGAHDYRTRAEVEKPEPCQREYGERDDHDPPRSRSAPRPLKAAVRRPSSHYGQAGIADQPLSSFYYLLW